MFFFFFNLPSMIWTKKAKDLFEKDGPNLSDFIFQNTHFLGTIYYLHTHSKKGLPRFLCRVKGIKNPTRFQT
jgi:hypothetical protein